jgi:hypothetical protein
MPPCECPACQPPDGLAPERVLRIGVHWAVLWRWGGEDEVEVWTCDGERWHSHASLDAAAAALGEEGGWISARKGRKTWRLLRHVKRRIEAPQAAEPGFVHSPRCSRWADGEAYHREEEDPHEEAEEEEDDDGDRSQTAEVQTEAAPYDPAKQFKRVVDKERLREVLESNSRWDTELVQALHEIDARPPLHRVGAPRQNYCLCDFVQPDGRIARDIDVPAAIVRLFYGKKRLPPPERGSPSSAKKRRG